MPVLVRDLGFFYFVRSKKNNFTETLDSLGGLVVLVAGTVSAIHSESEVGTLASYILYKQATFCTKYQCRRERDSDDCINWDWIIPATALKIYNLRYVLQG